MSLWEALNPNRRPRTGQSRIKFSETHRQFLEFGSLNDPPPQAPLVYQSSPKFHSCHFLPPSITSPQWRQLQMRNTSHMCRVVDARARPVGIIPHVLRALDRLLSRDAVWMSVSRSLIRRGRLRVARQPQWERVIAQGIGVTGGWQPRRTRLSGIPWRRVSRRAKAECGEESI